MNEDKITKYKFITKHKGSMFNVQVNVLLRVSVRTHTYYTYF
jgi:hypothetical protein